RAAVQASAVHIVTSNRRSTSRLLGLCRNLGPGHRRHEETDQPGAKKSQRNRQPSSGEAREHGEVLLHEPSDNASVHEENDGRKCESSRQRFARTTSLEVVDSNWDKREWCENRMKRDRCAS